MYGEDGRPRCRRLRLTGDTAAIGSRRSGRARGRRGSRRRSNCPASAGTSTITRSSSSSSPARSGFERCSPSPPRRGSRRRSRRSGKLRSSRAVGPYDVHLFPIAAHPHSLLEGRVMLVVAAMEPRSRGVATGASAPIPEAAPADRPRLPHGRRRATTAPCWPRASSGRASSRRRSRCGSMIGDELPSTAEQPDRQLPRPLLPPGRNVCDGSRHRIRSRCATEPGASTGWKVSSSPTAR